MIGRELRFDREALARGCSTSLEKVDVDLLVVLASLAFADRRTRRRRDGDWGRRLSLSIPVYQPGTWSRLGSALGSLLHDVSGDVWNLKFRKRTKPDELRQGFLPGLMPREFLGATVLPYSGGLDSFAALARHRLDHAGTPILLVHAQHGARSLRSVLPARDQTVPALAVPFKVAGGARAEPSYRTRTLIFFSLAALAWRRAGAARIWIGESGLGCMGPSLVPFGIEPPVRGCHPAFVAKLRDVFVQLWGVAPRFELPHLWSTKGEALRELADRGGLDRWDRTHSCSRNIRRQHPETEATHCGVCSGCLFRRQSLLAAGLVEPRGTYFVDVVRDAGLPTGAKRADREIGTYAVVGLAELAALSTRGDYSAHVLEVAQARGLSEAETAPQFAHLLERHASEWHALLGSLPQNSWVRQLAFPQHANG